MQLEVSRTIRVLLTDSYKSKNKEISLSHILDSKQHTMTDEHSASPILHEHSGGKNCSLSAFCAICWFL